MSWQATTAVTKHSKHSGSELLCLIMLANYADRNGDNIFPSIPSLSADCRMSDRGVRYIIARLIESGELEACGVFKRNVKMYRIRLPELQTLQSLQGSKETQKETLQEKGRTLQKTPSNPATAIAHNQYDQSKNEKEVAVPLDDGTTQKVKVWMLNDSYLKDGLVYYADHSLWVNAPTSVRNLLEAAEANREQQRRERECEEAYSENDEEK